MPRLIDVDAAIDRYYAEYKKQDICDGSEDRDWLKRCIDDAPTIEAEPVRHGRWSLAEDGDGVVCSCCGKDFCNLVYETDDFKYCPNCGAKMDGDRHLCREQRW